MNDKRYDLVAENAQTKTKYYIEAKSTDSASANTVLLFLEALPGAEDEKKQLMDAVIKIANMNSIELAALDGQLADDTLKGVPAGFEFGSRVSVPALRRLVESRRAEIEKGTELRWRLIAMIGGALGFLITAALQVYQVLK